MPCFLFVSGLRELLTTARLPPAAKIIRKCSAGNYDEYFGMATDVEAVVYLMLMNTMIHDYFPTVITIGEDVSGMPTFCR